jgi:hypothetical protein
MVRWRADAARRRVVGDCVIRASYIAGIHVPLPIFKLKNRFHFLDTAFSVARQLIQHSNIRLKNLHFRGNHYGKTSFH